MTINDYIEDLLKIKLFKGFDKITFGNFFKDKEYKIQQYAKEDLIFIEDEGCKNLSVILEGAVEIQKIDTNGRLLVIAKFEKGDVFGENLIFGDRNKYPMTVVSKSKSLILHIPKITVVDLCQINQEFLYQFLRSLSNRAVALSTKLKEVTLKTIRQKICEFLLMEYNEKKSLSISLGMSKKDWSDKIGVQRPSLSRELIKLKEEDIIDYDKDKITIKDLDSIKSYT